MSVLARPLDLTQLDPRRLVALSLPVVVPLAMTGTFIVARDRLGDHAGYVAGFATYWAGCAALSVGILGRKRALAMFRERRPRLPRPAVLGAALLVWPVAGAVATRFIPELPDSTLLMLATAGLVALANATLEELLWRGVYISLWPANPWLGVVWPAIGFGAWHVAPQVIHGSAAGPIAFAAGATAIGLSWGWVAWRTGSLRWVSVSHLLTDGSGIRNSLFFLGS
jgi:uncharacterized protein